MKFILLSAIKLKVVLDAEDLEEMELSYESMDYADSVTKQMLIGLLEQGKRETGFNPHRAKLYIEVYPCEEAGVVVYFTALQSGITPVLAISGKTPSPVVFTFTDADTLTDACAKVFSRYSHRIYKSSLYRMDTGYRLIVYPLDYADRLSVSFLSEFAPMTGEGDIHAAFIQEHGRELIADNALDILAGYFG